MVVPSLGGGGGCVGVVVVVGGKLGVSQTKPEKYPPLHVYIYTVHYLHIDIIMYSVINVHVICNGLHFC